MQPTPEPDAEVGTPRRRWRWVAPAVAVLVLAAGIGWAFQPWMLFTSHRVSEAMPGQLTTVRTSASPQPAASPSANPVPVPPGTSPSGQQSPECSCDALPKTGGSKGPDGAGRLTLRTGFFVGQEHPTTGTVTVIRLPDGRRFLRLQDLSTRNGPALHVWLSSQPVRSTQDSWAGYADADHRDLGALKGNLGNQNYEIPADVDLDTMVSVTIWSTRYSVSYGAASLQRQ